VAAGLVLASATADRPVPFRVGETLTYDVAWASYLTAGTAVAKIEGRQPIGSAAAYHLTAEGRPVALVSKLYPLDYRMEALLDTSTLLPHRASVYIEEGSRRRTRPIVFDGKSALVDPLSALYLLRASPLKPGARLTMPVVDNGVTYTVRFAVGDTERVDTPSRDIAAWKIAVSATDESGRRAGGNMAVWISTDPKRLPVRLEAGLPIGNFSLVLRDAK